MNKIEKLFLYITSTLFFLSMFIMGFSSVCHAEGSGTLPYIVPQNTDLNSFVSSGALETAINFYETSVSSNVSVSSYLVYTEYGIINGSYYDFCFITNPTISSTVTPSFDYLTNSITVSSHDLQCVRIYVETGNTSSIAGVSYLGVNFNLLGSQTTNNIGNGVYTPFYPFYMSGNDIIFSLTGETSSNVTVFTNTLPYSPSVPEVGHATQPTNDPNNFINGSNGQPVTRPTSPTINNYTWNTWTSPTVDTSTVESLLESLIDVVSSLFSWLGSNISGEFQNLVSNLENLFDFLVQGIENGFNKVISSIQGLGTDLYNNFVSLFEPITQQLSYISAPVDTELIQGEVESTSLMSDYSEVVSIKDSFVSVFTDTSEPSTFTIPIHLENLSILNVGTQYIDLSVINPVKSALRTFIWVIVSFSLVVTIIDSIPNYINGGGDE